MMPKLDMPFLSNADASHPGLDWTFNYGVVLGGVD